MFSVVVRAWDVVNCLEFSYLMRWLSMEHFEDAW